MNFDFSLDQVKHNFAHLGVWHFFFYKTLILAIVFEV